MLYTRRRQVRRRARGTRRASPCAAPRNGSAPCSARPTAGRCGSCSPAPPRNRAPTASPWLSCRGCHLCLQGRRQSHPRLRRRRDDNEGVAAKDVEESEASIRHSTGQIGQESAAAAASSMGPWGAACPRSAVGRASSCSLAPATAQSRLPAECCSFATELLAHAAAASWPPSRVPVASNHPWDCWPTVLTW